MPDENDAKITKANRTVKIHRVWGWFWYANILPMIASFFVVDRDTWQAATILYLAIVSIWALGISHHTKAEAAKAEVAGYENP